MKQDETTRHHTTRDGTTRVDARRPHDTRAWPDEGEGKRRRIEEEQGNNDRMCMSHASRMLPRVCCGGDWEVIGGAL